METFERALQYLEWMRTPPAGESADPAALMERFLEATFDIGLRLRREPSVRQSAAFQEYVQRSAALLVADVPWINLFIQKTINIFAVGFQHDEWLEVCRRRSALEFLIELSQGTPFEVYATTLDTRALDDRILEVGLHEGYLDASRIPDGIPSEHWWWWYPNSPP